MNLSDPDVLIPAKVNFEDLNLGLDADGNITLDLTVLDEISRANQQPPESIVGRQFEDLPKFLLAWYTRHRLSGGAEDRVCEHLMFGR